MHAYVRLPSFERGSPIRINIKTGSSCSLRPVLYFTSGNCKEAHNALLDSHFRGNDIAASDHNKELAAQLDLCHVLITGNPQYAKTRHYDARIAAWSWDSDWLVAGKTSK